MVAASVVQAAACWCVVVGLASCCFAQPAATSESPGGSVIDQAANALNAARQSEGLQKRIRVVDLEGQPVAGATVTVWAFHSAQGHGLWTKENKFLDDPPTVTTDSEGRATIPFPRYGNPIEKIPMDDLTCTVKHPDFATTRYNEVVVRSDSLSEEAEIKLSPGARVTVAPKADGVDLDRTRLFVTWSSPTDSYTVRETTDGKLELPRLPAGPILIRVAYLPDGGGARFSQVVRKELKNGDNLELDLELHPSVTLIGKVDQSVPRPVRDGIISAMTIESTSDAFNKLSWRTKTDIQPDGTFQIEDMPANSDLQVIALCEGFMATSGEAPDFVPEKQRKLSSGFSTPQVFHAGVAASEITLAMTPTVECKIKVVDQEGRPIDGAKMHFAPNVKWWNGGSQIYCHPRFTMKEILVNRNYDVVHKRQEQLSPFAATTDESGNAVVKNLPPRFQTFVVNAEGYEVPIEGNSRTRGVDLRAGGQHELTVTMLPNSPLRLGDLPQALRDACQIIGTSGVLIKPLPPVNDKQ